MPRIENNGDSVSEWCERTGNGSSTHDVCKPCYNRLEKNPHLFDSKLDRYNGDPLGEEGWGGDVCHPPYEGEDYSCEICKRKLTERDNGNI